MKPAPFDSLKENPGALAESLARQAQKDSRAGLTLSVVAKKGEDQGGGEHRLKIVFCLVTTEDVEVEDHLLGGELSVLRERASIIALDTLRKHLLRREGHQ